MRTFFTILLCLGLVAAASADVKIVQQIKSSPMMGQPAKDTTVTMMVKGHKARVDTGEHTYQIIDIDAGKVFIVDSKNKKVGVMTTAMMKQAAGMMGAMGGQQGKPKIEKLGTTHTYNGYKCEDVRVTMSGVMSLNSVSCVSKDLDMKEFEAFKDFGADFTKAFGVDVAKEVPGYAVHSESKISVMGQNIDSTTDLISITREPVDASLLVIPADYKVEEMKMPTK